MKKYLSIAEILAIELFDPTYPISLGKLGLRFFCGTSPHASQKYFFQQFFSKIFPSPEATLAIFLWIFAFFQLCPTWVFLKKCPNLPNFTLYDYLNHDHWMRLTLREHPIFNPAGEHFSRSNVSPSLFFSKKVPPPPKGT